MTTQSRFWAMNGDDPQGRSSGIVDEEAGGIIAYAVSDDLADLVVDLLNKAVDG